MPLTVQDAVDSLYDIAVRQGKSTSNSRMNTFAYYCIQELDKRGVSGAEREQKLTGTGRGKSWDVAWKYGNHFELAISLKSILANVSGSVPNRIDDLQGEVTSVQGINPRIVLGYIMVIDVSKDSYSKKHGRLWSDVLAANLEGISGRTAPSLAQGTIEAASLVKVDFSAGPLILTPPTQIGIMLDQLILELHDRIPHLR